jgi:hypothetical protein
LRKFRICKLIPEAVIFRNVYKSAYVYVKGQNIYKYLQNVMLAANHALVPLVQDVNHLIFYQMAYVHRVLQIVKHVTASMIVLYVGQISLICTHDVLSHVMVIV